MKEYATTSVELFQGDDMGRRTGTRLEDKDLFPQRPDGEGWKMCGSSATATHIYWFWTKGTE